ncbi:unnamed protein product, partial [Scytosiphon promiscuus]
AVFDYVLRVDAPDGDGGALGRIQAYIGMTEEQFRLTLHAHILVWVYGYNDREQLRDDLGTSLQKHVDLARYVGRIVCNQLVSKEEADFCLLHREEPTYS